MDNRVLEILAISLELILDFTSVTDFYSLTGFFDSFTDLQFYRFTVSLTA